LYLFFRPLTRPGVNLINILCTHFSYESALRSFSLVTFLAKKALSYEKHAHKMLMKLTPDTKSVKKDCYVISNFSRLGSVHVKASRGHVGEIDPKFVFCTTMMSNYFRHLTFLDNPYNPF